MAGEFQFIQPVGMRPENMVASANATREELEAARAYYDALMEPHKVPVYGVANGVSDVVRALVGGYGSGEATRGVGKLNQRLAGDVISGYGGRAGLAPSPVDARSLPPSPVPRDAPPAPEPPRSDAPIVPNRVRTETVRPQSDAGVYTGTGDELSPRNFLSFTDDAGNSGEFAPMTPPNAPQGPGGAPRAPVPTAGRGAPPAAGSYGDQRVHGLAQDTMRNWGDFIQSYVGHGGSLKDALELSGRLMPTYQADPYGREILVRPGLPPVFTGRQMSPGKETKIGDLPAYENVGPDGRPIIRMPRFEGDGGSSAPEVPGGAPGVPRSANEALTYKSRMEAFKKGEEEMSVERSKAAMKPVTEAMERGGQKAQDVIQVLDRVLDAYDTMAKAGTDVNGGPFRAAALGAQQAVNELASALGKKPVFDPKVVAAPEIIKKSTAELALKQIKEASARGGTQREFIAMLDNNPGLALSDTGSRYMADILRQQTVLDQKVGELAASDQVQANPRSFNKILGEFYKRPENRIVSPLTGKPLEGAVVRADERTLKEATPREPRGPLGTAAPAAPAPVLARTPEDAKKLEPGTRYTIPGDDRVRIR